MDGLGWVRVRARVRVRVKEGNFRFSRGKASNSSAGCCYRRLVGDFIVSLNKNNIDTDFSREAKFHNGLPVHY